jgi:CDGSH-type Zn-finger protein
MVFLWVDHSSKSTIMEKAKVAGKVPEIVQLEAGKTYAWCACGQSSNQPWCDGSHKGSSFTPIVFKAEEPKRAAMCMCKQNGEGPYCDGSHKKV